MAMNGKNLQMQELIRGGKGDVRHAEKTENEQTDIVSVTHRIKYLGRVLFIFRKESNYE